VSPSDALTRRRFLGGMAATASAVALGDVLAACGGGSGDASDDRVRVAATGLPTATSLDPRRASPGVGYVALYHLYDSLMRLEGGRYVHQLAESAEPDARATRWTVRLRDGATFHDGRPVRAADVLYSLRTIADPKASPGFALSYVDVDFAASRLRDVRTLELVLRRPRGDFDEAVLAMSSLVLPDGTTDFTKAVGSGPYRLVAADPGKSVQLRANDDYWAGAPRIQRLDVLTIVAPAARLNAVRHGQVDYAVGISPTGAQTVRGDRAVEVRRGGSANANALLVAMNATARPFHDPRVREALRLAVDRPALVAQALFGQGTVGNDLVGADLPGYASDLPQRERDLERARSLLSAAGVRDLTLRAADLVPGLADASRLLAQQLGEAGVRVRVQAAEAGSYFSDIKAVVATPCQAFYFLNRPAAVHLSSVIGPRAQWNLMGYGADYAGALTDAQGTVDDHARREKFAALQRDLYARGGEIVWGFEEQLDAARPGIEGVTLSQSVPMFAHARRT
jgi:peptide/nickel transport system substrate-binding protein